MCVGGSVGDPDRMFLGLPDPDPSLKFLKKGVGSELDPDTLVRGTYPGIRIQIRTKMSRIPNTGWGGGGGGGGGGTRGPGPPDCAAPPGGRVEV